MIVNMLQKVCVSRTCRDAQGYKLQRTTNELGWASVTESNSTNNTGLHMNDRFEGHKIKYNKSK